MEKHPKLKEKFQLLYLLKLNPQLKNNVDLGNALGKTKQSISRWCVGTSTSRGNCIPAEDIETVAELFQIPHEWFSLTYEKFETNVRDLLAARRNPQSSISPELSIAALPITNIEMVGRQKELLFLDACWNNPRTNAVEVIAFGGTGKSSLINYWLSELSKLHYRNAEKIYAWSFYWQGHSPNSNSSGDYFIEHALSWFGDDNPSIGTPWAKATRLANLIRASRTLLILDGLEPLQYPPGQKYGEVENPAVSFLIRELAAENSGLLVITTRYPVTDLGAFNDGRIQKLQLSNLEENSGIELLRSMGVTGSEEEFQNVVRSYAGHPLSLLLIAGYLTTVYRGELEKLSPVHSILFENHQENHVKRIMSEYFDWLLDKPGMHILRILALIDRTTTIDELRTIIRLGEEKNLIEGISASDESLLKYSIKELDNAKLISFKESRNSDTLECHPLVKDCVIDRLKTLEADIWVKENRLLFDYLCLLATDNPKSMEEMDPLFRAVVHGVNAGLVKEAFELYYIRIKNKQFSMSTEGSHHADQACVRLFFESDWDSPTDKLDRESQIYLVTSVATNLIYLGRISEAISPSIASISWFVENEDWLQAAVAAAPLLSMYIAAGELGSAQQLMEGMEQVIIQSNNEIAYAMASNFKAYIYHLKGEFGEAEKLFIEADRVLTQPIPNSEVMFPTISSYYCKFLLDTGNISAALERSLKTFGWRDRNTWQVAIDTTSILAADLLVLGLTFLEMGDKTNARIQLNKQIEILRSADEWLYLPAGLNSRARLHRALEDLEAATKDLEESLQISQRTGAKFGEWEAYLDLAHLSVQKNDLASASKFLDQAKSIPDMDSYKFRDKEIQELENRLAAY